jgi:hypothetical protein
MLNSQYDLGMHIEILLDDDDVPKVFPIGKASKMANELEKQGVKFRLGKTIYF